MRGFLKNNATIVDNTPKVDGFNAKSLTIVLHNDTNISRQNKVRTMCYGKLYSED